MISIRIEFEHNNPSKVGGIEYDSTEFDLEDSVLDNNNYDRYKQLVYLMNLWTEFVLENTFYNPQITGIEEVQYDGEES